MSHAHIEQLDATIVEYCSRVYQICAKRLPLARKHSIGIRIGHYSQEYRTRLDGTELRFEDGTSFAVPRLLLDLPRKYQIGHGEPELTIPIRVVHRGAGVANRAGGLSEALMFQIRERIFYAALNRYLAEKGVTYEVKVGPDIVEAFAAQDTRTYLRRYLLQKIFQTTILGLVALALTPINILMGLAALPSLLFAARIVYRARGLIRALERGEGGEHLLARIKRMMP